MTNVSLFVLNKKGATSLYPLIYSAYAKALVNYIPPLM